MLLVSCLLIVFYIAIIFSYAGTSEPVTWQNLSVRENSGCDMKDPHCPSGYRCYSTAESGICVKLTDNLTSCNKSTGSLTLHRTEGGGYELKCICRYPHLVTQMYDGSNCNVDVTCQPHGYLSTFKVDPLLHGRCVCDPPYMSIKTDNGPKCVYPKERYAPSCHPGVLEGNRCVCPKNFISSDSDEARRLFKPEYLTQFLGNPRCVPVPCSFNVFNNEPLEHTRVVTTDDGVNHCFCDPLYGNFGISLESQNYLNGSGYNACANVYGSESSKVEHRAVCFFYHRNLVPQCFLIFKNLNVDRLDPHLKGKNETLCLEDPWPYNFFNNLFRLKNFSARIHKCARDKFTSVLTLSSVYSCYEDFHIPEYDIPNCNTIKTPTHPTERFKEYNTVFSYPACKLTAGLYKDYVVLNPLHMSSPNTLNLGRTNGLLVYPDKYKEGVYTIETYRISREDFEMAYQERGTVPQMDG